ncbi:MAG: DUF885 family protein [Steroidobacteraceae bacterium]|nr:DUF885 family protein [Steroidobacteraceae bacterium]
MSRLGTLLLASILAVGIAAVPSAATAASGAQLGAPTGPSAGPPNGRGSYQDFVAIFEEFVKLRAPEQDELGLIDYSASAVARRVAALRALQARMNELAVASWDRSQQADFLAARAAMSEHDFLLNVQKPWARDPGFYVDPLMRIAFAELPIPKERLGDYRGQLRAVSARVEAAKRNLDASIVPADFAKLAIFNLRNSDGVGHGHPYREVPPAGVIGWYDDLLARAQQQQRALLPDIRRAKAAAEDLERWLKEQQPRMTAQAGFGETLFDWYLMHVKYMPYSSAEIEVLAQRELERTWAYLALERHRNRALPELTMPKSLEEYHERLASVDRDIRKFLADGFLTVPQFVPPHPQLGFNVPWIVRPQGPNFWERVQYRDPSPDHWHAVIPGHRFDAIMMRQVTHPVRRHLRDGGRSEGWALYLEEAPLQAGFYDLTNRDRTRELIYDFAIFRAARTIGDVKLQHNRVSTKEVADYWQKWTPYLDPDVARVDAEIYLRRPPGYGLGYTIGSFQMYKLLGELKHQQGEKFDLRGFHDRFLAAGNIPIALIRYEMTGYDDEVRRFWDFVPLEKMLAGAR